MNQPTTHRIAVVRAQWHEDLVGICQRAFAEELQRVAPETGIDTFTVPGAVEIPLHARLLALTGRYDAVVAMALVVDGGIFRHEFVAEAVVSALVEVGLATDVPVLSAVLTPHHFREEGPVADFFTTHMAIKGTEAASACVATLASLERIATMTG
ncbi:6,7-dimethyl-8-ribityllumazine synthase [Aeromicrobium sp. NPDC092404]|uniref:6,7-dimethyl-8-ribityllumazine synthase n=1 Tax=Aeromicrobium sp. NPDC092404 TaxID=3154976 RepID=UPI003439DB1E